MIVAFFCSITLVPAMLAFLDPAGEPGSIGFKQLAPLDDFLQRHRISVIAGTVGVALAGAPLLFHLHFDFIAIDLQNPNASSVVAYRGLKQDPETSGNDAEILAPTLGQANEIAKHLAVIPEVSSTRTPSSFIPADQPEKLAAIAAASKVLNSALNSGQRPSPASDQDTINAIRTTAAYLLKVTGNASGPGADLARHVSEFADVAVRTRAEAVFVPSLVDNLDPLRKALGAKEVTLQTLPGSLVRDWLSPDGRARVQLVPREDANDTDVPRRFATAVLAADPSATGPAISYFESGRSVTGAFIEATLLALGSITVLLLVALRRIADVLLTLIPLLLAGAVTLEISLFRCCSGWASRSRSTTLWLGAPEGRSFCSRR
jgi:uncharacterized protein